MEKKIVLKQLTLITSLLAPFIASAADKREVVTLSLPHDATVADVICSEVNGHIGFNIPLAPQFTKRGIFRSFPKGMSEYPAYFSVEKGRLTTASMVRFINQSSSLFTDKREKTAHRKNVTTAINAHKAWHTNKSETNLAALHFAEDAIFTQLKGLSLNNPTIRTKLEGILSSPSFNLVTRGARSIILPRRIMLRKGEGNNVVIKKPNALLNIAKHCCASFLAPIIFYSFCAEIPCINAAMNQMPPKLQKTFEGFLPIFMIVTSFISLIASFTDFKLTPEPGNGINVQIQVGA